MLQWSVTILRLSLEGRPMTAGSLTSTMWNLVFSHVDCCYLHGKLQVPQQGMVVPLYALSLMSRAALATSCCGKPSLSTLSGNIFLKVVSGRVLPCAPVSTFRIKLWMPGLVVRLTLTLTNASSIDDFMDDTLMSLKVSTSERVAICLASLDVD